MFRERLPVREAIERIRRAEIRKVGHEILSIWKAAGRVLAEDITSPCDVPPVDRSAVDGYAVVAEDTFGASPNSPIQLKVSRDSVGRGEAVRVSTGSPLPDGANAVVMVEYTKVVGDYIEVYKPVTPFENVCRRGEDVKKGETVLKKGEVLQPQDIGILASIGKKEVKVVRRPEVAVICTGDELVEVGEGEGVVNSNGPMICSFLTEMGCRPVYMGIVRDEFDEIARAISEGSRYDAVVVTGGSSVGERDLVPDVVKKLGKLIFHGVAIKPGMPTGFGIVNGKPVLMLPGFPVACLVSFILFFPEIMAKLTGTKVVARKGCRVTARLSGRIPSSPGVRTFARVKIDGDRAEPVRISGSGILSSTVKCEGIVVVPEEREGFEEGELVEVMLIRDMVERVG